MILICCVFILLFIEFFHPLSAITQDLGRHLKTGEIILQMHSVPKINFFSYTYPNFPFINTHWLSEVIFYWVYKFAGFHGLLIFTTLITLFAFGIVYFSAIRHLKFEIRNLKCLLLAAASLLYLFILSERTDIRPEIFSFLLIAVFISVLYAYREKYTPLIFMLPVMELFWVNLHIYFLIGEILIGLFLLEEVFHGISKKVFILVAVFLLTFLATLINPNGIQGASYPFTVFNNYGYSIQENQNIFFLLRLGPDLKIIVFMITAFILIFLLLLNFRKARFIDWLLVLIFTYLSASAIRNFVLFVFVTFIPFVYNLLSALKLFQKSSVISSLKSFIVVIILLSLIIWEGYTFINKNGFGWNVPSGAQPAADFFLQNHLKGPVFNNFDIGSYLDYRFYPLERVFADGRPEAYPASFFQNVYIPMQEDPKIFLQQEQEYKFNSIFFAHTDQTPWAADFIRQIMNNPDWIPIYLDSSVVILIKNSDKNEKLIKKFGMDQNSIHISGGTVNNRTQLYYLANFFINAGWINQEVKIDQAILQLDRSNCIVLARLTAIYSRENNELASKYGTKYQDKCL